MIHDKDFIIRIVRNFSEMLNKLILEKNEISLPEHQQTFDTQLNDVFRMKWEEFSALSKEQIQEIISKIEDNHQADYLDLVANIFFVKGKVSNDKNLLEKAKIFYELWLQKSGTFSLPVINRINEIVNSAL